MKIFVVLALCLAAVCGETVKYGFPSFQYSPITGRVVGGKDAQPSDARYIVSIQTLGSHSCGGSILNEKVVLTAAHCSPQLGGLFTKVVAGLYDLGKTAASQSRSISKFIQHEKYSGGVGPFDFALIIVSTPFTFNADVQPIGLPAPDVIHSGDATLFGWGSTSTTNSPSMPKIMKTVTKPIIEYNACADHLGSDAPLHPTNICTGPLDAAVSACSGDSGGPLVQTNEGKQEIIGVVSWGYMPCGIPDAPSVYGRVSGVRDWIDSNMV